MGHDSVLRHLPGEGPSSAWVLADLCPKPSGETTGTKTSRSLRGVSWEQRLKTPQQKRSKGRGQKTRAWWACPQPLGGGTQDPGSV